MGSSRLHITLIVCFAIILHLPVFTGMLNPVPPNFSWTSPWNPDGTNERGGFYDFTQEYLPWAKFVDDSISNVTLPLWNPYQFSGTPYLANHLLSPLYPPVLVGTLTSFELLPYIISLINFIIGPLFLYLYLKRIGINPQASLCGTILFCSTGIFTPYFPPWGASIVWIPPILYLLEGWMSGLTGWKSLPWMGIALGLWFTGGYPVFVVHGLYFLILYTIFAGAPGYRAISLWKFIVSIGLGIMLSAAQNFPTMFFALDSARFIPGRDELLEPMFNLGNILNHLIPSQAGAFKTGYLFIGLIPLLFIPFSCAKRIRQTRYYFAWFIISLLIGLIPGLFLFLYKSIPLWDITPHPPIVPLFIAVPVLAAMGLNRLIPDENTEASHSIPALVITLIVFIAVAAFKLIGGANKTITLYLMLATILVGLIIRLTKRSPRPANYSFIGSGIIAIFLLSNAGIFWINMRQNRPVDELLERSVFHEQLETIQQNDSRFYRFGQERFLPSNTGMFWGLEDAGGYDSLILRNYYDAFTKSGFEFHRDRESEPVPADKTIQLNTWDEFGINTIFVAKGMAGPSAKGWKYIPPINEAFNLYGNPQIWRAGFIEVGDKISQAVPLEYSRPDPNSVKIVVGGGRGVGEVVVKDTYAVGWRAWVDGKELPVEQYQGWMRKVDIPAGVDKLTMKYDPIEFRIGAGISLLTLLVSIILIFGGRNKKLTDA